MKSISEGEETGAQYRTRRLVPRAQPREGDAQILRVGAGEGTAGWAGGGRRRRARLGLLLWPGLDAGFS